MSSPNSKIMKLVRATLAMLAMFSLCSASLGAQTFPVTEWGPRIMPRVLYNVILDTLAAHRPGAAVVGTQPVPETTVSYTFAPSLERRRSGIARRIAQLRAIDSVGAQELARVTAEGDTIAAFANRVRLVGLNANSVSDVFAAWVTIVWQELHPKASPPASVLAVRTQVNRALREIPAFATATDSSKQEFAEALILHLMANAGRLRAARADTASRAPLFALLQRAGMELRVDFEHMAATTQGFMPSDVVKP
jgi:hypothetical protein